MFKKNPLSSMRVIIFLPGVMDLDGSQIGRIFRRYVRTEALCLRASQTQRQAPRLYKLAAGRSSRGQAEAPLIWFIRCHEQYFASTELHGHRIPSCPGKEYESSTPTRYGHRNDDLRVHHSIRPWVQYAQETFVDARRMLAG